MQFGIRLTADRECFMMRLGWRRDEPVVGTFTGELIVALWRLGAISVRHAMEATRLRLQPDEQASTLHLDSPVRRMVVITCE